MTPEEMNKIMAEINQDLAYLGLREVYRRLLKTVTPIPPIPSYFLGDPPKIALATGLSELKRAGEDKGEPQPKRSKYRHIAPKPSSTEEEDESPEDEEIFEFDDRPRVRESTTASFTTTTSKTSTSTRAGKAKAMPFSFAVARRFYPNTLEVVDGAAKMLLHDNLKAWRTVTATKLAGPSPNIAFTTAGTWEDKVLGHRGYDSVELDGKSITIGNHVLVKLDEFKNNDDELLPEAGYARIAYLYQDEHGNKYAHLQWLAHGSSIFSSLASSKELFFEYRCSDVPLDSIRGVVKVTYEAPKPSNCLSFDAISELKYHKGSYFCRNSIDETSKAITTLPGGFIQPHKPKEHPCLCCDRAKEQSIEDLVQFFSDPNNDHHFICKNDDYHLGDSVYFFDNSEVYALGRIISISLSGKRSPSKETEQIRTLEADKVQIELDIFRRYDELLSPWSLDPGQHTKRDERRLYYTGTQQTIYATALDGKCDIMQGFMFSSEEELNQFKDRSQHTFYVSDGVTKETLRKVKSPADIELEHVTPLKTDFKPTCEDTLKVKEALTEIRRPREKKLKGLSIFSGAGGLDSGLEAELGDMLEFTHAVELDEAAVKTLRRNKPNCTISCADASRMLERAQIIETRDLPPLFDNEGNVIPDLPRRGEVDVIVGGPCCQGFSMANRNQDPEDPRNPLTITFLSCLEWYRPKWFLLENVQGFRHHKLGAVRGLDGKKQGGLPGGMVMLVRRIVTGLGYQTHDAMLQAARYNVPSSRPRFILMASLPGYQLPTFPQPHNVSPQGFHLPFGSTWYIQGRAAPHHSYTVGDATTDLKLWEWEGTSCNERRPAGKNSIKQYHVKTEAPLTGDDVQFYGSAPLTEFQRRMRKGAPADVHNHVTHCTMNHVPRVCNIPARPDADHKDLPRDLQTPAMQEGKYNHSKERRYRRLDINEVFLACLTKLDPMGMKTRCLHPFLNRIISVREFARAMSFPDWYIFDLSEITVEDSLRQIGNAVPFNFAKALGEGLGQAILSADTTKSELQTQTGDVEMSDDFAVGTISDEVSEFESDNEEDSAVYPVIESEDIDMMEQKMLPKPRPRTATKHKRKIVKETENIGMMGEDVLPAPQHHAASRSKRGKKTVTESEDTAMMEENTSPEQQALAASDRGKQTTNSEENAVDNFEPQTQHVEFEIDEMDLSHHNNTKTGFNVGISDRDMETIFLEDDDSGEEDFGSDDDESS